MTPEHLKKYEWYLGHLAWLGYYNVGAEAQGANLEGANLERATYNVLDVLKANWKGTISAGLCAKMMAFDRDCHPHPGKFQEWAKGGDCPLKFQCLHRL